MLQWNLVCVCVCVCLYMCICTCVCMYVVRMYVDVYTYVWHLESKERLRIQPARLFNFS